MAGISRVIHRPDYTEIVKNYGTVIMDIKPIYNKQDGIKNEIVEEKAQEMQNEQKEKDSKAGIDIPEIILLLQTLGFHLVIFDKKENFQERTDIPQDVRIELSCPKSGMHAIVTKTLENCKCPSQEDARNAELWNISGCAPSAAGNISITHSSLLPVITPSKKTLALDLLSSALRIFNRTPRNEDTFSISKRMKSSESLSGDSLNVTRPSINIEPPIVPITPTATSSPITTAQLKGINIIKLTENLKQIKSLVDESLGMTNTGTLFDTSEKKERRRSDIKHLGNGSLNAGPSCLFREVRATPRSTNSSQVMPPPKPIVNHMFKLSGQRKDTPVPKDKKLMISRYLSTTGKAGSPLPPKPPTRIPSFNSGTKKK